MRAATAVDVLDAGQEANLFDKGAGPKMYREANVTELDSSSEEKTLIVDSETRGRAGFPHFSNIKIPYFFKTFSRLKLNFSRPCLFAIKKVISNSMIFIYIKGNKFNND